ncbi:uncharacterized protein Z519_12162 [Cladophialophora bantiana CBS 173.52]|uniref:STAS domain-containing protein n=1 Tax=Cladophialophora bantiana (strain ATCC 10958 / CBS 173.52 / CDC B-1940 / NIH 8579) TaxID=1442370 RepID=A0A0D2HSA0_CLAB1|nr:uncharacterized protein Z519_12162 [Cladophialophora bantiana CBS 173.52]KIW87259.1 hypothetical protein Z519_12162 [Cladophialophora bantiana CBS 173.52]
MADQKSSSLRANDPSTPPRRVSQQSVRFADADQYAPLIPSRLRETTLLSPEDKMARSKSDKDTSEEENPRLPPPSLTVDENTPLITEPEPLVNEEGADVQAELQEPSRKSLNERDALLGNYHHSRICGLRDCNHGTFSPRAPSIDSDGSANLSFGGRYAGEIAEDGNSQDQVRGILGEVVSDTLAPSKSLSTTRWLAERHGIKSHRFMYFSYYFPFVKWIGQYRLSWLQGDLVAAITVASVYIPMSLSYAANLAHVSPINGLYSFVFSPLIYALLGTCMQMVVGPEAAGSLLVGQVVKTCIERGESQDDDSKLNAEIGGVATAIAGAIIFSAGLARLGFLDSVLSRPFLRGFISAIGFVIIVDQLIPELGLAEIAKQMDGVSHGSCAQKLVFLARNIGNTHALTAAVSFGAFAVIMVFRYLKQTLQPRYHWVAYFPDRFIVVTLSAVLTWAYAWDKHGLDVLGEVKSSGGTAIPFHWPFQFRHMKHIDTALSTSFLIALLGFFESSVAAKSLGEGRQVKHMTLSANREMIALGAANIVGGVFMALPAFGGYGRSKVNASTGGTTPMSSIFLSFITLMCVLFAVPYFYYLPKGVLSAMISVVAYSLIEECPHDIKFFFKIRGWTELSLMTIIFVATVFYSLSVGMALGIGLSLLALIRHATKPRIQILGKVPGTSNQFENAELTPENIEYIEGCLIVKIPEPLTFANTGELKNRLRRLEQYGTTAAHPSLPRVRHEDNNRNIIFDVHGVTTIDGSGTQVFAEIVEDYVKRGIRVIICRLPQRRSQVYKSFERSGIVDMVGGTRHFVGSVEEALRLSEAEDLEEYFEDRLNGHHEHQH